MDIFVSSFKKNPSWHRRWSAPSHLLHMATLQRGIPVLQRCRQLIASGRGFKKDYTIKPGGSLVLGQDQDMLADDFNVEEAFVGELSQVNLWDKVLPE